MIWRTVGYPLVLLFISLSVLVPRAAWGERMLSKVALANDYYVKTQYNEAAQIYQQLVDGGSENGYLYYNLGNAYLRLGKTGPAILNYVRAKRFLPRDESLDANLRHAILKTEDQLEPPSPSGAGALFFWTENFTQTEHLVFLGIINLVFWSVLAVWHVRRSGFWNMARNSMLALLFISALSAGVKIGLESGNQPGVILAPKIDVKSDMGAGNVTLFQLYEGSVVSVIKKEKDWFQIQLNDGKKGWAQKSFIGT